MKPWFHEPNGWQKEATNRINSAGWEYHLAGNMTRGQNADGVWQRYEYDAAGRLKFVRNDAGAGVLENSYGASRQRIFRNDPGGSGFTWYVWGGDSVLAEYTSTSWGGVFSWAKSYIYAGSRLLFTATNNGAGGELKEYHHPDRLGTRMVTDPAANTLYLQSTLPFGTQFDSETTGSSNRLFTSYDRSAATGLDYAVNRTYSSGQGRFTTVDPIGMAATSLGNPQSLNLMAYVQNDPIDFVDPSGLDLSARAWCDARGGYHFEAGGEEGYWPDGGGFCSSSSGGPGGVGISEQVGIDNPPGTGEGPTDGGEGGGGPVAPPPLADDPCDVIYPIFPMRNSEWTGMVRKANTQYRHQFATANTADIIRQIGADWAATGNSPIRVGDASLKNGVDTPDHLGHQTGKQLDIGLFVSGGKNIGGVSYKTANYDWFTTPKLVELLQKNPNVTKIIFNDPQITGPKIVRDTNGVHDNHLHVEFDDGC